MKRINLVCAFVFLSVFVFYFPRSIVHGIQELCPNIIDEHGFYYREYSPATPAVSNFAVEPNGERMLINTSVGIYLYDARTLDYLETVRCEYVAIYSWSPDGSKFATFSTPCVGIEIWNAATMTVENTLPPTPEDNPYCADPFPDEPYGYRGRIIQLVWSADGRYLAAHAIDLIPTRIWDLEREAAVFETFTLPNSELTWSPEGAKLAYVHDCVVEQWEPGDTAFKPFYEIPCLPPHITETAERPEYSTISWSSADQLALGSRMLRQPLMLWERGTVHQITTDIPHILTVRWNSEGTLLAAFEPLRDIAMLDAEGELISWLPIDDPRVHQFSWHPDGEHLYVLSEEGPLSVRLSRYNVSTGEVVAFLQSCVRWRSEDVNFDCESFEG